MPFFLQTNYRWHGGKPAGHQAQQIAGQQGFQSKADSCFAPKHESGFGADSESCLGPEGESSPCAILYLKTARLSFSKWQHFLTENLHFLVARFLRLIIENTKEIDKTSANLAAIIVAKIWHLLFSKSEIYWNIEWRIFWINILIKKWFMFCSETWFTFC